MYLQILKRTISLVIAAAVLMTSIGDRPCLQRGLSPQVELAPGTRFATRKELVARMKKIGVRLYGARFVPTERLRATVEIFEKLPRSVIQCVNKIIYFPWIPRIGGFHRYGSKAIWVCMSFKEFEAEFHELAHAVANRNRDTERRFFDISWNKAPRFIGVICLIVHDVLNVWLTVGLCLVVLHLFLSFSSLLFLPTEDNVYLQGRNYLWLQLSAIFAWGAWVLFKIKTGHAVEGFTLWIPKERLYEEKRKGFVSRRAIVSPSEDFAESFRIYVSDGKRLREEAAKNATLREKYDFLKEDIFQGLQFGDVLSERAASAVRSAA